MRLSARQLANVDAALAHTKAMALGLESFWRALYAEAGLAGDERTPSALAEIFDGDRAAIAQALTLQTQARAWLLTLRRVRISGRLSAYDKILLGADER